VLVTFSIPLQVHPCRASLDAILKWRPNRNSGRPASAGAGARASSPTPLLGAPAPSAPPPPYSAAAPRGDHGSGHISDLRFALLTTAILIGSYATALNVSSLDRVLAYVGSTGSTSISFILPGLFYYKISAPDSVHRQRLAKEDDDAVSPVAGPGSSGSSTAGEDGANVPGGLLGDAIADDDGAAHGDEQASLLESGRGRGADAASARGRGVGSSLMSRLPPRWRWRRKWRWDMEHLEAGLLRKAALALAIYGMCVMVVCLVLNTFFVTAH
jgi:hypothetical protein